MKTCINRVDFIVCYNRDKESGRGHIFFSAMDKMVKIVKFDMVRYIKIHLDHIFKCFMTFDSFFGYIIGLNLSRVVMAPSNTIARTI